MRGCRLMHRMNNNEPLILRRCMHTTTRGKVDERTIWPANCSPRIRTTVRAPCSHASGGASSRHRRALSCHSRSLRDSVSNLDMVPARDLGYCIMHVSKVIAARTHRC